MVAGSCIGRLMRRHKRCCDCRAATCARGSTYAAGSRADRGTSLGDEWCPGCWQIRGRDHCGRSQVNDRRSSLERSVGKHARKAWNDLRVHLRQSDRRRHGWECGQQSPAGGIAGWQRHHGLPFLAMLTLDYELDPIAASKQASVDLASGGASVQPISRKRLSSTPDRR